VGTREVYCQFEAYKAQISVQFEKRVRERMVTYPSHGNLLLVPRNAVKKLTSIVVFAKVIDTRCTIDSREVGAIECPWEVFRNTSSQRCSRIDGYLQQVHRIVGALHGHLHEVRALVLQAEKSVMREIGDVRPVFEVGGSLSLSAT